MPVTIMSSAISFQSLWERCAPVGQWAEADSMITLCSGALSRSSSIFSKQMSRLSASQKWYWRISWNPAACKILTSESVEIMNIGFLCHHFTLYKLLSVLTHLVYVMIEEKLFSSVAWFIVFIYLPVQTSNSKWQPNELHAKPSRQQQLFYVDYWLTFRNVVNAGEKHIFIHMQATIFLCSRDYYPIT